MSLVQIDGQTFKLDGKVGEGCTAEVFKAISSSNQTVCVKVIKDHFYKQPTGKALIDNEVKILAQLTHSNLLTFRKHHQQSKLMIVTEYCMGGTLYDFIRRRGPLSEADTMPIMRQLVEGCAYMHKRGIIHRDLKPQNIFFRDKSQKEIVIADFGFAVSLSDKVLMKANVGSPLYMPYEALADNTFSPLSDIFALGIIWHELLTGRTPFQANSERQLKELTKKESIRSRDLPCDPNIKNIIFKCLKCQSNQRPSLHDILAIINQDNKDKIKSKSVFVSSKPSLKVQLNKASKSRKASKENTDPLLCHPGVTRNERCKTHLEKLKPIKLNEKTAKALKIDENQISKQLMEESKKQFSQSSLLPTEQLLPVLKSLTEIKMSFLPESVQLKFRILLTLYENLLTGGSLGDRNSPLQDELISSLVECKEEQDFCIGSFGFLRRLLRLAKTYSVNMQDLSRLWNHVQAKCLVRA